MLPSGFFGTRADLLMDVIFVATMATPLILAFAIRLAKRGQHRAHRTIQTTLLVVLVVAAVAFEVKIRLSGGSGSLTRASPYSGTWLLRGVLIAHILANLATLTAWAVLVIRSWRRFGSALPGAFTPAHRRLGRWVFFGTVFGAVSAVAMYWMGFVAVAR